MRTSLGIVPLAFVALLAGTAAVRGAGTASIPPWTAFGNPHLFTIHIDAAQVHDGVAPVRIDAPHGLPSFVPDPDHVASGAVGWMLDPSAFRGKRVRLHGELKTIGAARAAIWLRVDRVRPVHPYSPNVSLRELLRPREPFERGRMQSDALQGDHDWTAAQLEADIPNDALGLVVGDELRAPGTLWATYPTLEILGPARSPAAAATPIGMLPPARRAAVEASLRRSGVRLRTDDPAAPLDDLGAFDRDVANARAIGFGEAIPGSAETFRMKRRLLRDLVERHGVTVLAVDAGIVEARAMERYVSTGRGDPVAAVRALFGWPWQNQEMLALARWMRSHNASATPHSTLHFAGIDSGWFQSAAESVRRFAAAHDRALGKAVESNYACIARTFDAAMKLRTGSSAARACLRRADQVGTLIARFHPDADVAHDARVVEEYVEDQYVPKPVAASGVTDSSEPVQRKAQNVEWLARTRYPNAKVAVWSSNREIGANPDGLPDLVKALPNRGTLGPNLAGSFGASYVAIGFALDHGTFTVRVPNGIRPAQVPPAPDGTLESVLRDAGDRFYLPLRSLRRGDPLTAWLDGDTLTREVLPWYFVETSAGDYFHEAFERKRFDALIFIAHSHPTSAFRTARPPPEALTIFPTADGTVSQVGGVFERPRSSSSPRPSSSPR